MDDQPTSMQGRVWEEPIYGGWDEPDAVEYRLCISDQDGVRTWLVVERYAVCWLPGRSLRGRWRDV